MWTTDLDAEFDFAEHVENMQLAIHYVHYLVLLIVPCYCITFSYLIRVPQNMKKYSYYLMNSVVWCAFFDFFFKGGDYTYWFPAEVIGAQGFLTWIPFFTPLILCCCTLGGIQLSVVSLILLYWYRLNLIFEMAQIKWKETIKWVIRYGVCFCLGCPVALFILLNLWADSRLETKLAFKKIFHNLPNQFFSNQTVVLTIYYNSTNYISGHFVAYIILHHAFFLYFFPTLNFSLLKKCVGTMSAKTMAMHRSVLKALIIQTAIHFTLLLIPVFVFVLSYIRYYRNPSVVEAILLVFLGLHGALTSITMLVVHPQLFRIVLKDLKKLNPNSKTTTVSVTSRTNTNVS